MNNNITILNLSGWDDIRQGIIYIYIYIYIEIIVSVNY
jgi:hypothetical protein